MKTILVAPLLMALSMGVQAADTFRCKNDLVQVGDPKVSVMVKCGEPMTKDSSCQVLGGAPGTVVYDSSGKPIGNVAQACETVEEWTYNPGAGDFYTTIRMERGVTTSIRYGDRVR